MKEELALKWGSLKSWRLDENGEAFKALKRYHEEPVTLSAIMQKDTDSQKRAICDIIDALNADTIYNDWSGEKMTKQQAKDYVLNYGMA